MELLGHNDLGDVLDVQVAMSMLISVAVEGQKWVKPGKKWYRSDFGIKRSEIYYTTTYPKST